MNHIFKGTKVIELASVLAGPSVGMFFAELGAEVIKVENVRTKGDVTRKWKLPTESHGEDISAYFSSVNWGKKSIGLDLKKDEGRELLYSLVKDADFVISSYIPGKAAQLGVDADTLLRLNPGLVCGEISGYGEDEPRPAFDAIIQAEAGFTFMNGIPGQISKMPVALMDVLAAHQLKQGMLLAYIDKLKNGKGKKVHVSLIQSGIAALANQATNWLVGNVIPQPSGSDHPNIVPYGTIFQTRDSKGVVLAVGNDAQYTALCNVLELELNSDYQTNPQRVIHREEVKSLIQEKTKLENRDNLLEKFRKAGVPCGAVMDMREVFDGRYASDLMVKGDSLKGVIQAVFLDHPPTLPAPPKFGQQTKEILLEAGFPEKDILELFHQGIVA